jgi:hypothetical protein
MTTAAISSVVRQLLTVASIVLGTAVADAQTPAPPAADTTAKTLRPEVANPVNAAQEAGRAGQKELAETKLREAAAVPNCRCSSRRSSNAAAPACR